MSLRTPAILFLTAASTTAFAADPIFTDPVGFVKLGNTSASQADPSTPAVLPNSDIYLTVPLDPSLEFSGVIESSTPAIRDNEGVVTTPATITVAGDPWIQDQWLPTSDAPYSAIVASGDENGLRAVITGNSSDTLSVTLTTPGDVTLAVGATLEIRKCWTIGSFFNGTGLYNGCVLSLYDPLNTGVNHTSDRYTFYNNVWYLNLLTPSNGVIIYPGEMFKLRTTSAPIASLTVFGDVPKSKHRVDLTKQGDGPEDMEIGVLSPIPVTLGDLGIPANNGDELRTYDNVGDGLNKVAESTYTYYNTIWYKNLLTPSNSVPLTPGQGFKLRRVTGIANEEIDWTK